MPNPDASGHWGEFGGRFVPEALIAALDELETAHAAALADPAFTDELDRLGREYGNLPSPLYFAERLSAEAGVEIWLKREDLNHTGAHKIRNVLGQALLTKRMGKTRIIAETGAGQHGVAAATAAAYFGMSCTVYMGEEDTRRQALNVARMRLLGAEVVPGHHRFAHAQGRDERGPARMGRHRGRHALPDRLGRRPRPVPACWCATTAAASATRPASSSRTAPGALPDVVAACVGGGSNAMGIFTAFLDDDAVKPVRVRGRRRRLRHRPPRRDHHRRPDRRPPRRPHLRPPGRGRPDHRVALDLGGPGLPGRRPRARPPRRHRPRAYEPVDDAEAMAALEKLARTEGIICAIESAHGLAGALRLAKSLRPGSRVLVNLSGRGDKDMGNVVEYFGFADELGENRGSRHAHRRSIREDQGRGPRRAGGLPARGLPDLGRLHQGRRHHDRPRGRHHRAGPALLGPGHGRSRRSRRPPTRRSRPGSAPGRSSRSPRPSPAASRSSS